MFIIVFFLFTIYLNYSVDGNTLNVDRWSALENGAKALINGNYPYNFLSHMQHKSSNLPMLMILGLPFYLIFGSVGYLQSFCFLLFAFLIYKMFKSYKERLLILLLIVLSPSYVYEVYTKSDMMSNFIILLLGIYLILRNLEQKSAKKIMILGLFSSMLFLTRISSVIPLLLVLFYPFISFSLKDKLIFIISSLTTSIIILYIGFHNADNFSEIVKNNPFTVQATRQPLYITISFVILSILLSFRIKAKSQYYSFSGLLEQTHRDLVEDEIDKVIEKLAILELIISQDKDEDFDINSYLEDFKEKNQEDVNSMKKGLYMEFSGEIISRLDS
jgi:hypothetical protein